MIEGRHPPQARVHFLHETCIQVFRRIKIPMIILYDFIHFIKVIRIKMFALYAEVSFDRFGRFCKELRFVGIYLGDWVALQANRVAEFLELACVSTLSSSLTCFCN